MTALANLSDIVNRLTGGNNGTPQHIFSLMDGRIQAAVAATPVSNRFHSLWQFNQTDGANGGVPGAVIAPTRATVGAMPLANPGGGRQQWLLGFEASMSQIGTMILYDRLLHIGGLSSTSTSAQTVGGTLTRYTTNAACIGNQIWVEIYTAIGSTATTITASYTNQAGTSGRTTKATAIGGAGLQEGQRLICLPLADGDTGVQAVASVTLAASTLTAGNFGVTIIRPLAQVGIQANTGAIRDLIAGLPAVQELLTDSCLAAMFYASTTTLLAGFIAAHVIES
jgi:hypothetical protein